MNNVNEVQKEVKMLYYLLTDAKCPIWFMNSEQAYLSARWLVSNGVKLQEDHSKEGERYDINSKSDYL